MGAEAGWDKSAGRPAAPTNNIFPFQKNKKASFSYYTLKN